MKLLIILILFSAPVTGSTPPDSLTLQECYEEVMKNYPLAKQKDHYTSIGDLKKTSLSRGWYPTLDLSGQATYQSDVTSIDFSMPDIEVIPGQTISIPEPDIPEPPYDQYKASCNIKQMIYDGGIIKNQKQLEDAGTMAEIQRVEVELYKLKEQVNTVFFSIILLQEKEKLVMLILNELRDKQKVVGSGVRNGILTPNDLDNLNSEILKLEQQIIEINLGKKTAFRILEELLGTEIQSNTILKAPDANIDAGSDIDRPEYKLFELQNSRIDASEKLISSKQMPVIAGFGQLGYGRPGLNMMSDEFDSYYIVGASLQWNIWNSNRNRLDRQALLIQKNIISTQKETFDKGIDIALQKEYANIEKYEQLIEKDKEIINLKNRITERAESQLENGIITGHEYTNMLNDKLEADINYETHKILLLQSKINYLTIKGY